MKSRNGEQGKLFLFVNKDSKSKSLSKSEGASAKEINRHAQKVRNRRLASTKATSARTSSSSARRIALGGWNRREHDLALALEENTPSPPIVAEICNASTVDPSSSDVSPASSRDQSSESSSPSASSPDEQPDTEDDMEKSLVVSRPVPQEIVQTLDIIPIEDESPIAPASPRNRFSPADGVDPFGMLPIRINDQIHAALQQTLQIYPYSGNNHKLAFMPPHIRAGMNQFPITQVVHQSVYKEVHLYSLLATISCRWMGAFGRPMNGMTPTMYREKAAHHLRVELSQNALSGKIDKHTILDILFLAVSEIYHGDFDNASTHLEMVGELFHVLDTREHFDFWISESAAHVDNQLALSSGRRPVLPHKFDPGPLLPERMAALKREVKNLVDHDLATRYQTPNPTALVVASAPRGLKDAIADLASTLDLRMGTRFEYGLKAGIFAGWMKTIIQDLLDCVTIAKVVWLSPHAVCFDAEWLCRKARAVMRALLVAAPENHIGPKDLMTKCMEAARVSLLITMSHACTLIGFQTARANAGRLQTAMGFALSMWCPFVGLTDECALVPGATLDPFSLLQLEYILFSVYVGVWSSEDNPEVEEWFIVRGVNISRILGLRNHSDINEYLSSFLFAKTLQQESIRKVAIRLEDEWRIEGLHGESALKGHETLDEPSVHAEKRGYEAGETVVA